MLYSYKVDVLKVVMMSLVCVGVVVRCGVCSYKYRGVCGRVECLWCVCFFFVCFFFLMIRRPPRSTQSRSSAASDVYKRQPAHTVAHALGHDPAVRGACGGAMESHGAR